MLKDQKRFVNCVLRQIVEDRDDYIIRATARSGLSAHQFSDAVTPHTSSTEFVFERFVKEKDNCWIKPLWWNKLSHGEKLEHARMVGSACLTDGYIVEVPENYAEEDLGGYKVSETDGYNLLFFSQYWFRYIPKLFPAPSGLLIAVLQGVLTAGLTALFLYLMALAGVKVFP